MPSFFVKILIFLSLSMATQAHADAAFAQRADVQEFITYMVKKHHFPKSQLTALFNEVKIRKQIIQHINKPLEKETWNTYQRLFVSRWRIEQGVKFWNRYANVLKKAEQQYGVPANIIVATIGIETRYGEKTGDYRVLDSLSNLAFSNSSRAPYFRTELVQFLLLTRDEHLNPLKIMGSYAGAIGQPQFMPSSYRHYAVNFSKSGKTDLMHNEIDVIGSVANYYSKFNWIMNQPVAIHAVIIGDRYHYLMKNGKINQPSTIAELDRYGIIPSKRINRENLNLGVRMIELQGAYKKEYWIGFHNFEVIKRYNPSDLYAMAVFQLSDYITALRNQSNHG